MPPNELHYQAVIFDLGGVVLGSPLHAIADYEREIGIPANSINRCNGDAEDLIFAWLADSVDLVSTGTGSSAAIAPPSAGKRSVMTPALDATTEVGVALAERSTPPDSGRG